MVLLHDERWPVMASDAEESDGQYAGVLLPADGPGAGGRSQWVAAVPVGWHRTEQGYAMSVFVPASAWTPAVRRHYLAPGQVVQEGGYVLLACRDEDTFAALEPAT